MQNSVEAKRGERCAKSREMRAGAHRGHTACVVKPKPSRPRKMTTRAVRVRPVDAARGVTTVACATSPTRLGRAVGLDVLPAVGTVDVPCGSALLVFVEEAPGQKVSKRPLRDLVRFYEISQDLRDLVRLNEIS